MCDTHSCVTPAAGTSNELDAQNEWEENTHTHTHTERYLRTEYIYNTLEYNMYFTASVFWGGGVSPQFLRLFIFLFLLYYRASLIS